jgi:hypothetical protein
MEDLFVPYELALELKELGFDEPCFGEYQKGSWDISENDIELILNISEGKGNFPIQNKCCTAPIYSQAFKFFREKYNLTWEHQCDDGNISLYVGEITYPDSSLDFFKIIEVDYDVYSKVYEKAELECLKKLIEIVKK